MEGYSKSALIDLVVDLAIKEIGEDHDDPAILATIEGWMTPVLTCRGDRQVSLAERREWFLRQSRAYCVSLGLAMPDNL